MESPKEPWEGTPVFQKEQPPNEEQPKKLPEGWGKEVKEDNCNETKRKCLTGRFGPAVASGEL